MAATDKRKLKLQVQMTVDGFVCRPSGEQGWMSMNWNNKIMNYINELTDSVDTILLSRKMTVGFISHWKNVKPENPEYPFARKMVDKPKFVFTKTLKNSEWNYYIDCDRQYG